MANLPALAPEQVAFFHDQGYLILRQAARPERVARLRAITEQHLDETVAPVEYEAQVPYPNAPSSLEAPGGHTVRRLLKAWDRHEEFQQWGAHPDLVRIIAGLFGTEELCLVRNHHNCVMTKNPQYSSATLWHQDIRYWSFESPNLINAWLALGEETAHNGCMRVIPGSHKVDWEPERFDELKFFRPDREDNRALIHQALRAEMKAGDVLLFHSRLLHAAGRNHTQACKMALVFSYRRRDNAPLAGTRSMEQSDIPMRIEQEAVVML